MLYQQPPTDKSVDKLSKVGKGKNKRSIVSYKITLKFKNTSKTSYLW